MTDLLPIDLGELFHQELLKSSRPNDHKLHASSYLKGSLRHAQLDVAGAPKRTSELLNEITLMTGTLWHQWMHDTLRQAGVPYMAEVNLTPWMPAGWGGTADFLIWNPELKAFVLTDAKTTKGESLKFIRRDGAKPEHVAQTSIYWHAAKKMGIPLAKIIGVLYWPKNDVRGAELIEPAKPPTCWAYLSRPSTGATRPRAPTSERSCREYRTQVRRGHCLRDGVHP
jgi:hypothetical protein